MNLLFLLVFDTLPGLRENMSGRAVTHRFVREDLEGVPQEWRIVMMPMAATETWTAGGQVMSQSTTRLVGMQPSDWYLRRCTDLIAAGWRLADVSPAADDTDP